MECIINQDKETKFNKFILIKNILIEDYTTLRKVNILLKKNLKRLFAMGPTLSCELFIWC